MSKCQFVKWSLTLRPPPIWTALNTKTNNYMPITITINIFSSEFSTNPQRNRSTTSCGEIKQRWNECDMSKCPNDWHMTRCCEFKQLCRTKRHDENRVHVMCSITLSRWTAQDSWSTLEFCNTSVEVDQNWTHKWNTSDNFVWQTTKTTAQLTPKSKWRINGRHS